MERFMSNFLKRYSSVIFLTLLAGTVQADRLLVGDLDNVMNLGGLLIDIRSPAEAGQHGIIPGSHALPFFDDQGYSDGANWLAALKDKVEAGQPVVLVSQQGDHSVPLCNMLKNEEGFGQVLFLDGGINAWQQAGNEVQLNQNVAAEQDANVTMPIKTMSITE
jgi:rhodanese-related sulfurtransferase